VEGCGDRVTMAGGAIPRFEKFKYLGSNIENQGDIDEDIK